MAETRDGFNQLYGQVGSKKTGRGEGGFKDRNTTVEPSTPDETQDLEVTRSYTVFYNGKTHTILESDGGSFLSMILSKKPVNLSTLELD